MPLLIRGIFFRRPWGSSKNPFAFRDFFPKRPRVHGELLSLVKDPDLWIRTDVPRPKARVLYDPRIAW